ncbi:MAG: hypothetical protein H6602_13155 [Flavobacteriales bacterium]|nr:hypothetical protein [Flavobacteriales bacterium]
MKTRIFQILGVAAVATIGMVSCDTDACKDVDCGANGTCLEGDCVCETGYEGATCDTEERTKFIGSWNYTDQCYPGTQTSSNLTASTAAVTRVLVSNILGTALGGQAYAEVDGSTISIPSQQVTDVDNDVWTVSSTSGTLANNQFSISVTYTFNTETQTCTLSFSGQ